MSSFRFLPQQGLPQRPQDSSYRQRAAAALGSRRARDNPASYPSSRWNSEPIAALTNRLEELLVFELHKDGGRQYLQLTVRGLYRHVLDAITTQGLVEQQLQQQKQEQQQLLQQPETIQEHAPTSDQHTPTTSTPPSAPPPPPPPPLPFANSNINTVLHSPMHRRPTTTIGLPVTGDAAADDDVANLHQPTAVTYRERLGGYLHPRDMRRLVTPFSTSNEPELIVRRHVMLLNFDPLRAIILRDRLLVLVPDGADSLLAHLEQRVRGGTDEFDDTSIFGSTTHSVSARAMDLSGHDSSSVAGGTGSGTAENQQQQLHAKKKAVGGKLLGSLLKRSGSKPPDSSSNDSKHGTEDKSMSQVPTTDEEESDADVDEWHEMNAREWINLPFELQCADAVLHVVCSILSEDTDELQIVVHGYIESLLHGGHGLNDDPLTIIRVVKDAIQLMSSRVRGFVKSLNRILDEDEDMALMNLSRLITHPDRFIHPVPQAVLEEESDEPELILEACLQIALTLLNHLDILQGQINNAKELVDQKQDATRNRLLFANMMISVFSLCVAMASLIGSIFGMNVPNPLEKQEGAFGKITWGSVVGSILMCFGIMAILWISGTIPHTYRSKNVGL